MKLLVLYVDAWPYMYINFLINKIREVDPHVRHAKLKPLLGYTDCFKTSLLTGLYPDEHGYWVSYMFNEKPRPGLLPRSFSKILDVDLLPVRGLRFVLSKFTGVHMFHVRVLDHIVRHELSPESSFVKIDRYLRDKGFRTLFNEFERKNLKYTVLEDRFYNHRLVEFAGEIARSLESFDVVFAYIDEPDFWGHRYGVRDAQYLSLLQWLSNIIKHLIKFTISRGYDYIIFSDHGMADVGEYIDLYHSILLDKEYGRTYVAGIDATFFRIYYLNNYERDSPILSKIKRLLRSKAFMLTKEDRRKYRLPIDRRYGDEVYVLREGAVFYPNFFSWLRPRGMHAYDPNYNSQLGIVLGSKSLRLDEDAVFDAPKLHWVIGRSVG